MKLKKLNAKYVKVEEIATPTNPILGMRNKLSDKLMRNAIKALIIANFVFPIIIKRLLVGPITV